MSGSPPLAKGRSSSSCARWCHLLAAAQKEADEGAAADPYLSALCYFNALRELGGARRIVEDEVMAKLATYGD